MLEISSSLLPSYYRSIVGLSTPQYFIASKTNEWTLEEYVIDWCSVVFWTDHTYTIAGYYELCVRYLINNARTDATEKIKY